MKKYIIIAFLILLIGAIACEKFLEEEPKALVTEENFFGPTATEAGIEQFINGIYPMSFWTVNDRRWAWFATVPADDFDHTLAFDGEGQEYDRHDFNSSQFNIFRQWNYVYWPVAKANTFLAHYEDLVAMNSEKWTKLNNFKGQALFLRAAYYFFGVQMWGSLPLVTTAPDAANLPNTPVPEVYNQIIADLKEIIDNGYLPEWNALADVDKGRATMSAAKSILAKVYLTKSYHPEAGAASDVDNAVAYARDVVENSGHDLIMNPILNENGDTLYTAYEAVFLPENKNGLEGIWEFQFYPGVVQSAQNLEWVPLGYFGNWGNGRFEATPLLYNSFEPGDERKKSYIFGDVVSPATGETISTDGKIYMTKFQDSDLSHGPYNFANNWIFCRFADILLIYAEALNKQNNGPTAEAYEALNRVRRRAGLPDLTGADTYDTFLKAIQDERFKELAGEGHRLVDLRRWGYNTLKERVEMSRNDASVEPHEILWPFPSYELSLNPMLQQNPGYN